MNDLNFSRFEGFNLKTKSDYSVLLQLSNRLNTITTEKLFFFHKRPSDIS